MDTRELILSKSKTFFATKGFDGISMNVISKACNISKASIYNHFKSKGEIYNTIVNQIMNNFKHTINQIDISDKNALSNFIDIHLNINIEDYLIIEKEKFCNFNNNINEEHEHIFNEIVFILKKIIINKTNKESNNHIYIYEIIKTLSINYAYEINLKNKNIKKEDVKKNIEILVLKIIN